MKKWVLACLTALLVCLTGWAMAELEIVTPYEREILKPSGGYVTFEWVPQEAEMEVYVIDAEQNLIFSDTVLPQTAEFQMPVNGLLEEGEPYLLMLLLGDEAVSAAFSVDLGGGRASSVDWSAGLSGSSGGNSDYGMITFNTSGLEGLAQKIVELYNEIVKQMAELSDGYSVSNSRGVNYMDGEEGALINPIVLRLANPNGFYPNTESKMITFTDQIFELILSDYDAIRELGYVKDGDAVPISKRYEMLASGELTGGAALQPVQYFNDNSGVFCLFFALTNEKGTVLLDENIYAHLCVGDESGKLVSMLITEQEEIAEMLKELGVDKDDLAQKLPEVMSLGFTQERLTEELIKLVQAGEAQHSVRTEAGRDYSSAAHDEQSEAGKSYQRILWGELDDVFDDVLDTLIQEKTQAELAPNVDWQLAMYKGALYTLLSRNTEGIGETAAIASEYLKAIYSAYTTADKPEAVAEVTAAMQLPTQETWARLLAGALETLDFGAQGEKDLAVLACALAEQTMNEAVLAEIAAAAGADSALGLACEAVRQETDTAFGELVKTLGAPLAATLEAGSAGKRIADLQTASVSAMVLSDTNAESSTMGAVYAQYGVSVVMDEMEASLEPGERLIQMNLIRDALRALVEAAYQGAEEKADALYTLTKLYLIVEERCLAATQSYFGGVESSWFASTFVHETVTSAKAGEKVIGESLTAVQETGRTLRDQRTQCLNARQKASNAVLGRSRTAVVNTRTSPLTLSREPEKKGGTVCMIPKGETVTVLEEGEWPLVEYDGQQGYVDGQYLL